MVSQVVSQVGSQNFKPAAEGLANYGINSLWCSWGAYVSFFRDVCGWEDPILEKFEIDEALMQSVGWTWWHQNVLALSDRPSSIKRDDQGRLHCENGPAISYRDGWALWFWHGVSVPQEWILDKSSLTAKDALGQENTEKRRAACEIVGWARILKDLKAKTINVDSPQIGTLVEVDLPDSGKEKFLRVMCGTGREFAIPVPKDVKTAMQANLWTYGIDGSDKSLLPEVRT